MVFESDFQIGPICVPTRPRPLYVAYLFDKNQSNSFPCFTLFFPAFHDEVNAYVMGSLIER